MAEKSILEILEDAKKATILAEGPNGEKYVPFEDYVNLTTADVIEGRNLVPFETNPDGSPAGTSTKYLAVSLGQLFLNRFKHEDDKLYVVTDWWSINEQASGRPPMKLIPCYVIAREGKKLKLEQVINITDTEFLSDFRGELGYKAMAQILPLISAGEPEKTTEELPI